MLVTLYILNHNYAQYLEEAIYSGLNQDYDNFEIIIIDDGSTDESIKILEKYQDHSKIRIIRQENIGLMASINVAWKEARGSYILRLDADDTLRHDALKTLVMYVKMFPNADWIFPGFNTTNHAGTILKSENRGTRPFFISKDDLPPHGACSLIKLSTLFEIGGYSETVNCRDGLDLFLKLRDRKTILSIPERLFYYRRHDQNLTLNKERIELSECILNVNNAIMNES